MSADGARSGGTFFLFICLPAGITIIACGDEIPLALGLQPARLFYQPQVYRFIVLCLRQASISEAFHRCLGSSFCFYTLSWTGFN
jgi:hypothetical protein